MVSRFLSRKQSSGDQAATLPGRSTPLEISGQHLVLSSSMVEPFPENSDQLIVGMGCFWGVERLFWTVPGVYTTAAGYAGGTTPNPTYEETCTGRTGHTEVVLVVFDPDRVALDDLLKIFWENHDPTQKDRQGNDIGSQYRSALFASSESQLELIRSSVDKYQSMLADAGFGSIETEVGLAGEFYYAEEYHQQYLAKNPNGYCNHGFCQVAYSQG